MKRCSKKNVANNVDRVKLNDNMTNDTYKKHFAQQETRETTRRNRHEC